VDLSKLADRTERINITMSKRLLRRVDAHARKMGETRSGLLARGAMELMGVVQTTDRAPKRPARRRR
jgi:metal-responsive CopG/Arc/MetJ family transcriptional regulator